MATTRSLADWLMAGAIVVGCATLAPARTMDIVWDELPALPPAPGHARQAGLAGPFAGVHHDALLVAGGANFPEQLPWLGGTKVWWDTIFVLENLAGGRPRWHDQTFKLPRPIAYGVSVDTPEGVVCIGGCDAERCYADVFLLAWDPSARR